MEESSGGKVMDQRKKRGEREEEEWKKVNDSVERDKAERERDV